MLFDAERCRAIFDRVFSAAHGLGIADAEAIITVNSSALTRFANNAIHQNVAERDANLSVRVQIDGRTARATTNRLDDDSIRQVLEDAVALTKLQEPDADLLPMAEAIPMPDLSRWYETTAQVTPADVVTCHHVVYNVPDLGPFLTGLTNHARRRVVVELTTAHPLTSLNPLWLRFHGLRRPAGPTATDLLAILAEAGLKAGHTGWSRPAEADYAGFAELVDITRRRLCLPADRASEVEAALLDLGSERERPGDLGSSGRNVVTIWWEGTA